MRSSKKTYIWLPLWIVVSIAIGIFIGNAFSIFNSRRSLFSRGDKLEAILEYINESYVDTVDIQELVETAIPGLIAGLDPHSVYFTAKDMELVGEDLEGHFSGIGVQFVLQKDSIVVVNIIPGGPSEAAGLIPGDRIVFVNDSLYAGAGITNDKVMRGLRGKYGTSVKLGVKRYAQPQIVNIEVMRGNIPVNSIDAAFTAADKIGYIKINKFANNTYDEFISALSKLKKEGSTSFIIDLRQNSGGSLTAAVQMIKEIFSAKKLIVYLEGRTFPRKDEFSDGSGTCQNDQIIVLIDEGSASASEIFAGAIQDHDRGLIIGRRSYGKGLVQNQREFRDGSALRLTIARYHTPSGRCIQKAYERGKSDDYNQDLMNRYLRGEFDSQDSIKMDNYPLFKTLGGRNVRGNDGIMPDIFIPRDTIGVNSYYTKVVNTGALYEYAFTYTDNNREKLKSFATWQDLSAYLSKQPLVLNLVSFAESKGIRQRPYLIEESRNLFQTQLEAYIIRNIFGDEGFYRTILNNDLVLNKAITLLKNKKAKPEIVSKSLYK